MIIDKISDLLADEKKKILIQMATAGLPKPRPGRRGKKKDVLSLALYRYTNPNDKCYDAVFAETIRRLQPDWLKAELVVNSKLSFTERKEALFELACQGAPKPIQRKTASAAENQLAKTLYRLTTKNDESYDSIFDKKIRRMAPHWFKSVIFEAKKLSAEEKKKMLFMLAAIPESSKPQKRSKDIVEQQLARSLMRWTNIKDKCYNAAFTDSMRKIRPEWCCGGK